MNDRLKKLEHQKLIQEYNFLITDFKFKNEVINEYTKEFYADSNEKSKELVEEEKVEEEGDLTNKKYKIPEQKKIEPKIKDEDLPEGSKEKIKKIYREIAKITHPDKINSQEHIETYIRAKDAYESNDLMELYFICSELHILVDVEEQEIAVLKKLVEIKKQEVKKLESSIIWMWIHTDDEKTKEQLVMQYLKLRTGL